MRIDRMDADVQPVGDLLAQPALSNLLQDLFFPRCEDLLAVEVVVQRREGVSRTGIDQLCPYLVGRLLVGRDIDDAQNQPYVPVPVRLQNLKLLRYPFVDAVDQRPVFTDELEVPDIGIRIFAQKDMPHARHAVFGHLHKIVRMDPYPGILLPGVAEKRPVKIRLVDMFAPVQVENRQGAPRKEERRAERADMPIQHGGVQLLFPELLAGQQLGILILYDHGSKLHK